MKECKCNFKTKLVGDGCEICNPELAEELKKEDTKPVLWYCCGGIILDTDKCCPICGDEYE